ncbi:DUF6525 family protein [Paracoccus maritimus]
MCSCSTRSTIPRKKSDARQSREHCRLPAELRSWLATAVLP